MLAVANPDQFVDDVERMAIALYGEQEGTMVMIDFLGRSLIDAELTFRALKDEYYRCHTVPDQRPPRPWSEVKASYG